MKFGVFQNQYYSSEDDFEATDLYEQAQLIEDVGFDSVALGERHVHEEGFVEPLTALSGIAARTSSLELATTALLPLVYHPLHLAEQIAAIDRLSDGRVTFGGALGYRERELEPFGVPSADRDKAFIDVFELLKRLWNGERVSYDGPQWSFEDVFVSPPPVSGRIPTWIGGHADVAIKRAAYRSNGWIASASSTRDELERQVAVYEDALSEFGEDREKNDVILMRDCYVADSAERAREEIEPYLLKLYRMYASWGQTGVEAQDVEVEYDELAEKFIVGTPNQCIEELRTYENMGVDQVIVRCQFPGQSQDSALRCLERFGDEIIPTFGGQ